MQERKTNTKRQKMLIPSISLFFFLLLGIRSSQSITTLDCSTMTDIQQIERTANTDEIVDVIVPPKVRAVCSAFEGIDRQDYLDWYEANDISTSYPNIVYMPGSDPNKPENGVAVHWNVQGDSVYLAVAARAKGWVGFGIAEAGGMLGTDMVIFEAARPNDLIDAYTADVRFPQIDDCSNDWELIDSHVHSNSPFIMFETRRLLDTGDAQQDKIIHDDSNFMFPEHRVIAAWGDSDHFGYHGLNRSRSAIRFFQQQLPLPSLEGGNANDSRQNDRQHLWSDQEAAFQAKMNSQAEGSFMVRSVNHGIRAKETEYAYTCVSKEDLIRNQGLPPNTKLSVIGFEPVVSEETKAYVHHFIVHGSSQGSCASQLFFYEMIYGWAPGEQPVAFDDGFGIPLFGDDGHQAFQIQVHYNNPHLDAGKIDSSGVRLYWTSQPRSIELGMAGFGDVLLELTGVPVGKGLTSHHFFCPGSCSSNFLSNGANDVEQGKPEKVTVLQEYFHMHGNGKRITHEQIRTNPDSGEPEVIRAAR